MNRSSVRSDSQADEVKRCHNGYDPGQARVKWSGEIAWLSGKRVV